MASTSTPIAGAGEMCRLTIYGPASRVELAVPAHVPIADLLPTVLGHLDPALATTGLGHGGWALQRLGEPPLDEDHSSAAVGLFDGDVLHLRPRDELLPLADFDDLVDGVRTGLARRRDHWRPALTRRTCLAVAGLCAVLAVLVAWGAGSGAVATAALGGLAAVLLAGAWTVSKVVADRAGALVLGTGALQAAATAGLAVPAQDAAPHFWPTGPGLLGAGVAVAAAAVILEAAIRDSPPLFLALASGGLLAAGGGALVTFGVPGAATILLCVALLLTKVLPTAAARLAGLVAEPVPTSTEEFQQGLDPHRSADVLARANRADQYMVAFLAVLAVVFVGDLGALAMTRTWQTAALVGAACVLLLMQARELTATWQRVLTLGPALWGSGALVWVWSGDLERAWLLAVLVALVGVAVAALAAAHVLPGRKLVPVWGRIGDIVHWLCAIAVVPLALWASGAFHAALSAWQ